MIDQDTGEMIAVQSRSADIGALAGALAKAQGAMPSAVATKALTVGGGARRNYAGLDDVWDACRKPLADNGLSVAQQLGGNSDRVSITTLLMHESGQWLQSSLSMAVASNKSMNDIQSMGSAISYARRYALAAIVGVAVGADDDDGERAVKPPVKVEAKTGPAKPSAARMTAEQRARLGELGVMLNMNEATMIAWLTEHGFQTPLTPAAAPAAIAALEAEIADARDAVDI